MVSFTFKALAVLAIAAALAVIPADAQQIDQMTMTVPFAFSVDNTTLPAGTYRVLRMSSTTGTYMIRSVDGKGRVAVLSPAMRQARVVSRPKLVFNNYAGEYFLSQIWMPWSSSGADLATSRRERRLARANDQPRLVALVADRP